MAWFRRRRSSDPSSATAPEAAASSAPDAEAPGSGRGTDLVPMVSGQSIARTERALKMLAAQSAQLHSHVVSLERRVDALSDALLDQLDVPNQGDLLEARMHSARVAAELSRLEVNLAARLDAVRDELRVLQGQPTDIDLRSLVPTDTGWTPAH